MNKQVLTHMTKDPNLVLRKAEPIDQIDKTFKPMGFWYAIGNVWIDWCTSEMPDWVASYIYTFDILVDNNMLYLNTRETVYEFSQKYGKQVYGHFREVDWQQVTEEYDGVEFNPYFYNQRFATDTLWYNGIDVPSGVIFNTDIILNINRHITTNINTLI